MLNGAVENGILGSKIQLHVSCKCSVFKNEWNYIQTLKIVDTESEKEIENKPKWKTK